jgi:tight adherence protein C
MSALLQYAALGCIAAGTGALILLIWRRLGIRRGPEIRPALRLPLLRRMATPLATLLEPAVASFLGQQRVARSLRQLESLGLAPGLTAERWCALSVAEAILVATLVIIAGGGAWLGALLGSAGYMHGGVWLRQQRELRQRLVARELPAWLDLMTVCVEAGATLTAGLRLMVTQAPGGPLRDYFERVLREIRGGRPRAQAFTYVAELYGIESLATLASALSHAESSGMSLGEVLRAQAAQRTAERFARAEKLAMQAPVKMLGPLILCIFPCTFIVIGVPIAVRLKEALGA